MVKGRASPDDPSLKEYWKKRSSQGTKFQLNLGPWGFLAKKQNYVCPQCGQSLNNGELLEQHHIIPRAKGGGSQVENLQLLHFFCHQQITANQRKGENA